MKRLMKENTIFIHMQNFQTYFWLKICKEKVAKVYECILDAVTSKFERVKYMGEIYNPYRIILKFNIKCHLRFVTKIMHVESHISQSSFFQQHFKFI